MGSGREIILTWGDDGSSARFRSGSAALAAGSSPVSVFSGPRKAAAIIALDLATSSGSGSKVASGRAIWRVVSFLALASALSSASEVGAVSYGKTTSGSGRFSSGLLIILAAGVSC